jgi:hypothetical protein
VYIFRKTIRREKEEFRITETSEFLTNEKRSSQEKNIKINKDNRNTRVRKEILILRWTDRIKNWIYKETNKNQDKWTGKYKV